MVLQTRAIRGPSRRHTILCTGRTSQPLHTPFPCEVQRSPRAFSLSFLPLTDSLSNTQRVAIFPWPLAAGWCNEATRRPFTAADAGLPRKTASRCIEGYTSASCLTGPPAVLLRGFCLGSSCLSLISPKWQCCCPIKGAWWSAHTNSP